MNDGRYVWVPEGFDCPPEDNCPECQSEGHDRWVSPDEYDTAPTTLEALIRDYLERHGVEAMGTTQLSGLTLYDIAELARMTMEDESEARNE